MKINYAAATLVALALPVLAQTPAAPTRQVLVNELVVANHILANEGVLDGYGHVSVRSPTDPSRYLLARAGAPGLVTVADITEYDLDSQPVTASAAAGYTERFIHGEIYKARPDVMAVVHCHCLRSDSIRLDHRADAAAVSHGLLHRRGRARVRDSQSRGHRHAGSDR